MRGVRIRLAQARPYFAFVREREAIRIKKEAGHKPPWTDDLVLQQFRFCNVWREDDRTTRWFAKHLRDPADSMGGHVLFATTAFRWFNRIETGEQMLPLLLGDWNLGEALKIAQGIVDSKQPFVTGAYMVRTKAGKEKHVAVLECIDAFHKENKNYYRAMSQVPTLQHAHELLQQVPFMGRFTGYEVVTDLRHTHMLRNAPDINTWASVGPGAARGLGWICHDDPKMYSYYSDEDQDICLGMMRELLEMSSGNFPTHPKHEVELREIEHSLCEYDKWCRAKTSGKMKRRYKHA